MIVEAGLVILEFFWMVSHDTQFASLAGTDSCSCHETRSADSELHISVGARVHTDNLSTVLSPNSVLESRPGKCLRRHVYGKCNRSFMYSVFPIARQQRIALASGGLEIAMISR